MLRICVFLVCFGSFVSHSAGQQAAPVRRPNVLMLVADDMNWDSPGCFGGAAKAITPNIDQLAREGMRFWHAYVNISICTPSRSVMLTGLYQHNNGAEGFQRIRPGTANLPALLNAAGYLTGTVGKPLSQQELFRWSVSYRWPGAGDEDQCGRDPEVYRQFAARFFAMAKSSHQPFFLMASSHDPHSPFAAEKPTRKHQEIRAASKRFTANQVNLPPLLPDRELARKEFADYCTSVRRLDDAVGVVLDELSKSGLEQNTIVVFLSDHGMPFPGAKFNCYMNSLRTPMIVKWPNQVKAESIDREHMISAIDLMPTILEAVGLPSIKCDGRSFVELLQGKPQANRNAVFAQFYHIHGKDALPMRSILTKSSAYVFNPWSNGERRFMRLGGRAFQSMKESAKNDPKVAARIRHLTYRSVEEFFELFSDPHCMNNLLDSKTTEEQQHEVNQLRSQLRTWMIETKDPALSAFEKRESPQALDEFTQNYRASAQRIKDELRSYEKKNGYRF